MAIDPEIIQLIIDQLDSREKYNEMNPSRIPSHVHNNTDAPPVAGENLVMNDEVTNDVSTTAHGFVPKLPDDATKFLDGTGAFSTPGGGGAQLPVYVAPDDTAISITTGSGTVGNPSADFNIQTGTPDADANGGNINITSANGADASGAGGRVNITSGNGGNDSHGGVIDIIGGVGGGTHFGGYIELIGGVGGSGGGDGGQIDLQAGRGGNSGGYGAEVYVGEGIGSGTGGFVDIQGGAGSGSNKTGGSVTIQGGDGTGAGHKGDVQIGSGAAIATSSNGGFLTIPFCAGAPSGVPSIASSIIFDTTNNKLYIWNGAAWKSVTLT